MRVSHLSSAGNEEILGEEADDILVAANQASFWQRHSTLMLGAAGTAVVAGVALAPNPAAFPDQCKIL